MLAFSPFFGIIPSLKLNNEQLILNVEYRIKMGEAEVANQY